MAYVHLISALLFALALARIDPSTCRHLVHAKVSCVDCTHNYDLSDIKVSVKCEGVKKLAVASTEEDGSFKVVLPSDHKQASSVKCLAKLLGGPVELYVSRKNQVSQITKDKEKNVYTLSTPLSFMTSCPQNTNCKKAATQVGSSKTVDLPLPPEWGLAPTSYYVPFFPIIGIP